MEPPLSTQRKSMTLRITAGCLDRHYASSAQTAGVAVLNDRLYALGGFNGKKFLNSIEYLDLQPKKPGETVTTVTRRLNVPVPLATRRRRLKVFLRRITVGCEAKAILSSTGAKIVAMLVLVKWKTVVCAVAIWNRKSNVRLKGHHDFDAVD